MLVSQCNLWNHWWLHRPIWFMKEMDYGMSVMTMGWVLCSNGGKEINLIWTKGSEENSSIPNQSKPLELHFCYQHCVENHNILHHSFPSIERTWTTDCWSIPFYSFFLAMMVIISLSFTSSEPKFVPKCFDCCFQLAWQTIDYIEVVTNED